MNLNALFRPAYRTVAASVLLSWMAIHIQQAESQTKAAAPSAATLANRASALYDKGDYAGAFALYQRAANMGNLRAEDWLGAMYRDGLGVQKDYAQAYSWFVKAANEGFAPAERNLGSLYQNGLGTAVSFPMALYVSQMAADQGDAEAQWRLGFMFLRGQGVTRNDKLAWYWFQKAADQGDSDSENFLGYMYLKGIGVSQNTSLARSWLKKAANQGNTDAKASLASMNAPAPSVNTARQPAPQPQQVSGGTCAAVYIVNGDDERSGSHFYYGAAWYRSSYEDALAGARSELMKVASGPEVNARVLPGAAGQYGAKPEPGSGCTYAHGAVAGKLKIAAGGSSAYNLGGAAGTGILGPGIYDAIAAGFAGTTDAAVSQALSKCRTSNGGGDNDHEVCTVLKQW